MNGVSKGVSLWQDCRPSEARFSAGERHGLLLTPSPHKRAIRVLPKTEEQREEFWHAREKTQNKKI